MSTETTKGKESKMGKWVGCPSIIIIIIIIIIRDFNLFHADVKRRDCLDRCASIQRLTPSVGVVVFFVEGLFCLTIC